MGNKYHGRFSGASWYGKNPPVLVGGAGGTGSWAILLLARMGIGTIGVYDNDSIDNTNMAGQFYKESQIGEYKVKALYDNIKEFTTTPLYLYQELYTENSRRSNICFACFDNMKARKIMFEKWKQGEDRELFVDIRLDFEQVDIFLVTKVTEAQYQKEHLFDDTKVPDLPCTMKQTTHVACLAASLAVAGFTNYLRDNGNFKFHQTYVIPLNYFSNG